MSLTLTDFAATPVGTRLKCNISMNNAQKLCTEVHSQSKNTHIGCGTHGNQSNLRANMPT